MPKQSSIEVESVPNLINHTITDGNVIRSRNVIQKVTVSVGSDRIYLRGADLDDVNAASLALNIHGMCWPSILINRSGVGYAQWCSLKKIDHGWQAEIPFSLVDIQQLALWGIKLPTRR